MDDKDKSDPASEFGTDSSWSPLADGVYFFPGDRESNILSEFGWNFQQDVSNRDRYGDLDLIVADERSDLAGSSTGGGVSGGTVGISEPASASVRDGSSSVTTTSNNPSVSSSSSEDQPDKYTDSGGKPPPEKPSKIKKKGQKRIRQPRFAFMTKSETEYLEDGYRWRKYGQKAVKNSPFPRSYYRCTNNKCTVKKRVERSCEDPSIVITTYEGQHCHHTVGFPRTAGIISPEAAMVGRLPAHLSQFQYPTTQLLRNSRLTMTQSHQDPREAGDGPPLIQEPPRQHTDEGLLGDIVPPGMR